MLGLNSFFINTAAYHLGRCEPLAPYTKELREMQYLEARQVTCLVPLLDLPIVIET